ncbi:MAG TPA: glycerate kinase [Amnibacterium sp.]|nr:glycerate kinase [Amnibacterium sp.]
MAVVVFAPNAFKGSIGPAAAAEALAAGWARVRPDDELRLVPMADGGDGTLEALAAVEPAIAQNAVVPGPDGGARVVGWIVSEDGTATLELASVGGLAAFSDVPNDPRVRAARASTLGFGTAVRVALERGATEIVLAIGGSASTDGGAGFLTALGARLLDADGVPIPPGNAGLARLDRVDVGGLLRPPARGAVVLTDVTNPLLGPAGAAAVFAPQKGAAPDDLPRFEANLARFADRLARALPADPDLPGAGAAGGLGFGLHAWGARIADGAAEVARRAGLGDALAGAAAVVTGEGRYDAQTAGGKAPARVRLLAAAAGVPALLVAGGIDAPTTDWADSVSLSELAGSADRAIRDPAAWLAAAGALLAERSRGND